MAAKEFMDVHSGSLSYKSVVNLSETDMNLPKDKDVLEVPNRLQEYFQIIDECYSYSPTLNRLQMKSIHIL